MLLQEFISVWVRDPRIQKGDSWQSYVEYEICVHTNSMCFRKKTSCVRRRYREFVWLKQRLQDNALLIIGATLWLIEFISVWVRDPRIQKGDSWQSYVEYEICVHTNSMCFRKKTSCVRRRYREFVWLKQRLQDNALLISSFVLGHGSDDSAPQDCETKVREGELFGLLSASPSEEHKAQL
ncbi:UNVERIFIED_CONTAM: hypothetical protein FKN15_034750 [Acipenser sinensis]